MLTLIVIGVVVVITVGATLLVIKHNKKGADVAENEVQILADKAKAEAEVIVEDIKKKL